MKKLILLLAFFMMIFLVGGVLAENQTCITEPGRAYYPGTEKCCNNLTSIFGSEKIDGTCSCTEKDNNCGGASICAPCGNGKCEIEYGEDRCNCAEDCNPTCASDKDCWDKYQNCYYACQNQTCKIILGESEIRLPDYPNCSQGQQNININYPQDVMCTDDVKECPDGSFVSRAGFNCEFMSCPEAKMNFFARIINWFKNLFS